MTADAPDPSGAKSSATTVFNTQYRWPVPSMLHNNQTSQQLTLRFTNVTVLTVIELHYKFWKWHNLQRSWNIENHLYSEHEIQKRWPQNYDVMIWWRSPRHAPHIWGRRRRCVFDLPYACMCKYTRGSKLKRDTKGRSPMVRQCSVLS